MAKPASNSLFLFFLSLVPICSSGRFAGPHTEVGSMEKLHIFPRPQRQLLKNQCHLVKTLHGTINLPTTIFPATPVSATPVTIPPDTSTPTYVANPVFNPVTDFPTNPATPATVPSTTAPITIPSTNPITAPITVPGAQPLTNPVTTYPAPSGNVPVTTPVVTPPATTNAPAISGHSWCVAKSGALETALQAGLDYACGMGSADCSQIKQGGSCFNPDTVENHASYAFNSYYQKNHVPTSCDFGGTATIVNINPSTGSCIYPASSSSATPTSSLPSVPASTTPIQTPTTTIPTPTIPTPTTTPPAGSGVLGYGTPPTVLNTSNPALGSGTTTGYGSESPPGSSSSASPSAQFRVRPLTSCIGLLISLATREIILDCRLVNNCGYT